MREVRTFDDDTQSIPCFQNGVNDDVSCFSATELSARIHCTGCTRGLFSVAELVYTFGT